jgi:hypothetical protein
MSDFGNGATIGRAVLGMRGIDTTFDDNVAIASHAIPSKCALSRFFLGTDFIAVSTRNNRRPLHTPPAVPGTPRP